MFEKCKGIPESGRGWCDDTVKTELVGDSTDRLASFVRTHGRRQILVREAYPSLGVLRTEVEDLSDGHLTEEEATWCHHSAGHAVVCERVDEMPICLDRDRRCWAS